MSAAKRFLHDRFVGIAKVVSKLLPDRTPVTFVGSEATRELCEAIAQSRPACVGIVTDEGLVSLGVVERVTAALDAAGVRHATYSGVLPDPTFTQVEEGRDQLLAAGCDAILAVGGGSPMDAAKVIAAAATNPGPVRKLEGRMKIKQAPLPLYALPTTAGTGSEATLAAVVSDAETHTKYFVLDPKLLPLMAGLDPTLMLGLPPHVTAATGMDALTHAIESVLAKTSTRETESFAEAAIRRIFPDLPRAHAQGDDLEARKSMSLAAYYAGLAFTRTSVGYVHAIAHNFGAYYGTPHGLANAIALPHVLDYSLVEAAPRMALMAEWAGVGDPAASETERAQAFIAAVRELSGKIQIPTTLDALQRADIPSIATKALAEAHMNYPVPRYMEQADCEALLENVLA
ncbi:MAG: iron-containing alcohol dehydrogenase [Myxococcota bacterium]|nr:iron-containing alcohol dehydrogenase [Myxococcota bacterium]